MRHLLKKIVVTGALTLFPLNIANPADTEWKNQIISYINDNAAIHEKIALDIGSFAEVGYRETKSTAMLQDYLKSQGFNIPMLRV